MVFPHMNATITFHSEAVIPHSQNFSGHGMSIGMRSKGSFMHLYQYLLSLSCIHTLKQYHVMVPLV